MSQLIINSHEEFEKLVGKEVGVSDYLQVTQDQINLFAEATIDHHEGLTIFRYVLPLSLEQSLDKIIERQIQTNGIV